jgi:hypothetical protein
MALPKPLLHIPYMYVMVAMFCMAAGSLIVCLFLGTLLHLDETTGTHCEVPNIVPSISAVIGGSTPERYIWRLGIAFFSFPRTFESFIYHNFFSTSPGHAASASNSHLNKLVWLLHVGQCLSLFILTYVSSTEYYEVHRNGFIGFIACSILHMLAFLFLFRRVRTPFSPRDRKSFRLRVSFTILHILFFVTSIYFFKRHNDYCEPYMYSLYGALEYLVVFTNIAFHTVATVDFGEYHLTLAPLTSFKYS